MRRLRIYGRQRGSSLLTDLMSHLSVISRSIAYLEIQQVKRVRA